MSATLSPFMATTACAAATILIVEDDPDLRAALEVRLAAVCLQVSSTGDGRKALELVHACRPDLVVLDLGLPGVDGLDLLERLAKSPKPPRVIVLSAWDEARCLPLALARGASLYLEKPAAFEELLAGVQYLLNNGGA